MGFHGYRDESLRFYIRSYLVTFRRFKLGNTKHPNSIEDNDEDLNLPTIHLITPPLLFCFESAGYCGDGPSAADSASRSAAFKSFGVRTPSKTSRCGIKIRQEEDGRSLMMSSEENASAYFKAASYQLG